MGRTFKETSHLNIDPIVYGENYDHIFKKKEFVEAVKDDNDAEGDYEKDEGDITLIKGE